MKTRQDLMQIYRTEFGCYPSTEEYKNWLEEKILQVMNELPKFKTTFERQMEKLDRFRVGNPSK